MIQEFSVQNFLSYKEKETISFVATKDKHLLEELTIEVKPNLRLLRMAMIFGANASGKSNLLIAMNTLWKLLFVPENNKQDEIDGYHPFALLKNEPTRMESLFWAMGRCYHYEIAYNAKEILFEKLQYTTDSNVLSLMYERLKGENIKFGTTLEIKAQERNDLNKETLSNHTVLSTFGKKNIKVPLLEDLHKWIHSHICELGEYDQPRTIAEEAEANPEIKALMLGLMREADFNIADFEEVEMTLPKGVFGEMLLNPNLPESLRETLSKPQKQLLLKHKTTTSEYSVGFGMESAGTQAYFRLARLLFNLKYSEYVFMEDELDDKLHYELLVHYLQTFLQVSGRSQLIFSSHNLLLLDESWIIRRDMVYLTDRDKSSASSRLSRVSDMGLHKNISMLNAYRIGKLGGKPRLGSTYLSMARGDE